MNIRHALAAILLIAAGAGAPVEAQYFGQNRVQYERFDFRILQTEHFDIYYYPEQEAAVQLAARMAERWYARLSRLLDHELSSRQPLILYSASPHFRQTNAVPGEIGEGVGGVTEFYKRRIVMPFGGGLAETDHVLGHELVHAFQYDIATDESDGAGVPTGMLALPLWFIEGMAEYLSLGPVDANTAMWIRDAASREEMPSLSRLDDPNFFPYRYGHAFWAYVAGRWGDATVGDMMRAAGRRGSVREALDAVLAIDADTFTAEWHAATRRTYDPIIQTTEPVDRVARAVVSEEGSGGQLNLAPSISPDGRRVVFLSERSLFSIDMYVADVATGRIERRLVQTAGDPHFDSLQFLNSAGDWAPDNRRFVFAALRRGQPVLAIVDTETGRREAEHAFPDLGEIFTPSWSPDGRRIVFAALTGGLLNLHLFDLETGTRTALTSDAYSDLQPVWSPDGRRIAWATDRFTTNLDTLQFGNYRIASMDVETRQIQPLAGFDTGRNSNPAFSPDGRTIYFIGTPDGISNIYRAEPGGATTRLTNVLSGVSGITPATPALSVARQAESLVFTIFADDQYTIYALEGAPALAGQPAAPPTRNAAILPPPETARPSEVARLLASPTEGLPAPTEYPVEPYQARLSLDHVGQPVVGVGADRFGAYAAGGISFLWSDMLGNHQLGTNVQVTSRLEELGGSMVYINQNGRWNWGIIGEQTPYVTGSVGYGFDGAGRIIEQETRWTQINRGVSGLAQYPLSRAQRLEFAGGYRHLSFDLRRDVSLYSPITGGLIDRFSERLDGPSALGLGEATAALVYDSSLAGLTGPILGQRYRLEYTQTAGTLTYAGVLADYRRYFMPFRPFTFAFRGMQYGRYGRDSEDNRLAPLYIGYPGLVRGYQIGSFRPTECLPDGTCPAFDQLIGSRMALGSAEIRVPLWGLFRPSEMYGPLPLELALFGDAGVAWASGERPAFAGGARDLVRSAGAAARVNVFGYAVFEVAYVRPFDRPARGWLWQFNVVPGF